MVKNLNDGRVHIEAKGNEAQLKALHAFCCEGPPAAKVANVESEEAEPMNYQSFLISR
jgi:acylphosphatase